MSYSGMRWGPRVEEPAIGITSLTYFLVPYEDRQLKEYGAWGRGLG
jgi:hypothetical protein